MILADTSAWVEFLRGTQSPVHRRMYGLLDAGDVMLTEPVQLELLAGRTESEQRLRRLLATFPLARVRSSDYDDAATLFNGSRRAGRTPRSLLDCLIAAVAIRRDLAVLTTDRDFEAIAAVSSLRLEPASP